MHGGRLNQPLGEFCSRSSIFTNNNNNNNNKNNNNNNNNNNNDNNFYVNIALIVDIHTLNILEPHFAFLGHCSVIVIITSFGHTKITECVLNTFSITFRGEYKNSALYSTRAR